LHLCKFADGADPETMESRCGHFAHTPQRLYRKRMKKIELCSQIDNHQTIGFGTGRSDLGQEFCRSDTNR
jgi:hypothetical protein